MNNLTADEAIIQALNDVPDCGWETDDNHPQKPYITDQQEQEPEVAQ